MWIVKGNETHHSETVQKPGGGIKLKQAVEFQLFLFGTQAVRNLPAGEGELIFLPKLTNDRSSFSFGRVRRNASVDILLPETKVAMKQITLIPDLAKDFWRIQSNSETIATVDDVPIQKLTARTRKNGG